MFELAEVAGTGGEQRGELLAMPILPPGDSEALARTLRALGELAAE